MTTFSLHSDFALEFELHFAKIPKIKHDFHLVRETRNILRVIEKASDNHNLSRNKQCCFLMTIFKDITIFKVNRELLC